MTPAEKLKQIERRVWDLRQGAFQSYYNEGKIGTSDYERGLEWGTLATLDTVLDEFRNVIDGTSGRSGEQVAKQKARVGR